MTTRWKLAGATALLALATMVVGPVSAQPRETEKEKSRAADDARYEGDDFGPCGGYCFTGDGGGFGPGAGHGWARGGMRRHGGPGMRGGFGGPGMGGPGMGGGFGMMGFGFEGALLRGGERMADALDLTEAQRERLRDIREEHHRSMIRARAEMDLARMDLVKLLQSDDAGEAGVERQIDALVRLQADQMKSMAAAHRAARAVLTAKQLQEWKNWRSDGARSGDDDRPRRGTRR
ncbi:MAG TPA: Spy/CpxP family protein refolding chaperone [Candidatus Eisenbacteria bacterium]|nr:Spy/CpxP family protein refolding chaperone [Candidatus Eisenbacteria bacterium]